MNINSLNTKLKNALRIDRAIRFVWQASPLYTLLSGIVVIIAGCLPLLSLYLIKLIIDAVTPLAFNPGDIASGQGMSRVFFYICLACGVGLLTAFFSFLSDYLKKAQSLTVTDHMFSVLHAKSMDADLAFYESSQYQDTLHRAQMEGPYRPTSIVNGLFLAGQNAVSFVAVFLLLTSFAPFLSLVIIGATIPGIIFRLKYSKKIYSWQEKRTEDERKSHYYNHILTGDAHAKELRLFNLGPYFTHLFKSIRKLLKGEKLLLEKKRIFGDFMAQSAITIAAFGTFAYIAYRTVQGSITLGDMVMYFQAFQRGVGYLKTLLESMAQMYEDNLFLSNFYDFLNLAPRVKSPETPLEIAEPIVKGIEFKDVNFFYQSCGKKVLNCVNFSIKPGEIVALVGENGSGKSTIVKLLSRLYDPDSGNITLDGTDIKNFRLNEFRKKISIVFQDPIKYHLSVRENIFLGNVDQRDEMEKIKGAAGKAGIDKKIMTFKSGYDTILGRWFKDGEELSIGQWQMVAISRAFFKDAAFVVFDEPSSALDPETEKNIFSKLKTLMQGRSALIISHRYSTVKMADKILVLDKGSIVEQGSHVELMKQDGKYARLFSTQAKAYL
ncbi:MAG: ABC transporter ATP-binding protein [Desulfobacula sp.]|jgi:ATP-binding cassette subfamily B protein|nr:ABC transporter ATP-binding protein [Desulfobacula sp.]